MRERKPSGSTCSPVMGLILGLATPFPWEGADACGALLVSAGKGMGASYSTLGFRSGAKAIVLTGPFSPLLNRFALLLAEML